MESARIPAQAYVEPAHTFHYGSDDDRARAEDWIDECLSFGPGGGFLYLADLGPHDFLYVLPSERQDRARGGREYSAERPGAERTGPAPITIDLDELHETGSTRINGFRWYDEQPGVVDRLAMGTVPPKAGPDVYL